MTARRGEEAVGSGGARMVAAETASGLGSGGDAAVDMAQVQADDVCTVMSSMMDKEVEQV